MDFLTYVKINLYTRLCVSHFKTFSLRVGVRNCLTIYHNNDKAKKVQPFVIVFYCLENKVLKEKAMLS